MSKKILILSPQPFFETRGTPLNVREMLYALSEAGYEVTLLAYPFGVELKIPNVTIIRSINIFRIKSVKIGPSYQKIILDVFFFIKALKLALKKDYDLFHGIEEASHMACIISFLKNKPFIADVDSCIPEQLKNSGFIRSKFLLSLIVKIEKICFGRAAKVLTVCKALTDEVKNIQPKAKVEQIEDFPIDEKNEINTIDIRQKFDIASDKKIIVYAGNFEAYQGVDLLIKAFANLEPIVGHLVLVGGLNKHIEEFKKLANELGISEQITFTGNLDSSLMPSIHNQADVLVSPRLCGKNTPLKIYSYMSASKLIIATKIVSHTQVLSEKEAILCEPNIEQMTIALTQALNGNHESRISAAKNLVETRYSRDRFRADLKKMYNQILCQ